MFCIVLVVLLMTVVVFWHILDFPTIYFVLEGSPPPHTHTHPGLITTSDLISASEYSVVVKYCAMIPRWKKRESNLMSPKVLTRSNSFIRDYSQQTFVTQIMTIGLPVNTTTYKKIGVICAMIQEIDAFWVLNFVVACAWISRVFPHTGSALSYDKVIREFYHIIIIMLCADKHRWSYI